MKSLLAALSLYTRLPFWRLTQLDKEDYQRAILHWPLTGFLTGGVMALVICVALEFTTPWVAVILGLGARMLLTGGFHEDGLGDFFDGFGGGRTKEQVLTIMKDSHIGSYAVLGYIIYFLLMASLLVSFPQELLPYIIIGSDIWARFLSRLQLLLPYARTEATSKLKLVYDPTHSVVASLIDIASTLLLSALYLSWYLPLFSLVACALLILYIRKRIGGYTGDTLGAIYLITEVATLLSLHIYLR